MGSGPSVIDALRAAILQFGDSHPEAIRRFAHGQRIIHQGDVSNECFLIKGGVVSILVRPPDPGVETQVALRFEGDLIGETAFLQRNAPRTASVEVSSESATLVRIARNDIFALMRADPGLQHAVTLLWELAASRQDETTQVLEGHVTVENRVMSALLADIHNFSALGEATWEEQSNSFLFEFIEQSHEIATHHKALFEDQGDGFRVLFLHFDHATSAIECATSISDVFRQRREAWLKRNDAFANIGLGIGICTDCMSVRKREGSPRPEGRVLSHAINIAASMSKCRLAPSDVDIYTDENTVSMQNAPDIEITGPRQTWLEKLGRIYPTFNVKVITSRDTKEKLVLRGNAEASPFALGKVDDEKISILFLSSDPTNEARLRLGEEAREIREQLKVVSKNRDRFCFEERFAVRPQDVSQALLDIEPQIVHFSGHGTSGGGLCFEDKVGRAHIVSPESLAALFQEFSRTVKCVVLNACFSEMQAESIVEHIEYVIGMDKAISDIGAIAFAVGLYQAMGAGKTIQEAYKLGCVQIGLQSGGKDENVTPILKMKKAR